MKGNIIVGVSLFWCLYLCYIFSFEITPQWIEFSSFLKDSFPMFTCYVIFIIILSYSIFKLNEKITEKIIELKKFKEFMNMSQEGIIMLKDNEVEYAND